MKLGRTPFVITLLLGSLSLPLAAGSQQPGRGYRVGLLNPGSLNPTTTRSVEAFRSGLRDLGWVEGQNLVIEMRSAEGRIDRLLALASELVSSKVDVLVALTSPSRFCLMARPSVSAHAAAHPRSREPLTPRRRGMRRRAQRPQAHPPQAHPSTR